jgi:hypothetical protein
MKTTKKDKEWFAERAGELLLYEIKINTHQIITEALERHKLEDNPENREVVAHAYRTANPRYKHEYAHKTYHPLYQRGAAKNTPENSRMLGYLAIDKELSIKAVRDEIVKSFKTGENPGVDANLIDIFKYGVNLNEVQQTGHQSRSTGSDEDSEIDELDNAFRDDTDDEKQGEAG